ncbi:hypothetical protein CPAV1605_1261 [seawater metagenome]|uniref:Uncharacterized protein n=1 Tax=seawater metagenome TaxID=1561972 RepID=A0A5E8CMI1_9ZZZZ
MSELDHLILDLKNKKNNLDFLRLELFKYFQYKKLTIKQSNYLGFYKFINDQDNQEMLKIYLQVVLGMYDKKKSIKIIDDLLIEYKKISKLYTFKQLYEIDPSWHEFYKENTDKHGKKKENENRKGVRKTYVNDVMIIKKLVEYNIKEILDLETCMFLLELIRTKTFCLQ